MPGTKRAAEEEHPGPTTRSAKTPKTESMTPVKGRGRGSKKGPKTTMAASQFKNRAMPLHVNFTHTPPALLDAAGEEAVSVASQDPGNIGTTTLVPSTFSTGSYGWKGSKRVTIELQNADADGEKEKVHVMITINATVMGSKGAKEEGEEDAKDGEEHTGDHAEEQTDEAANGKDENGVEPKDGDITEALLEADAAASAEA